MQEETLWTPQYKCLLTVPFIAVLLVNLCSPTLAEAAAIRPESEELRKFLAAIGEVRGEIGRISHQLDGVTQASKDNSDRIAELRLSVESVAQSREEEGRTFLDWIALVVPPLVTGIIAAFFIPYVQNRWARLTWLAQKRVEIWLTLASNWTAFANQIALVQNLEQDLEKLEDQRASSTQGAQQAERLEADLDAASQVNNEFHSKLVADLLFVRTFFRNRELHQAIEGFQNWYHEQLRNNARIETGLNSPIMEYRDRVLRSMRPEIRS